MEQQDGQQPKKRARKTIALETKIKMIGEVEAGLMTMTDIAKKYDINKQTLSNIVSCKDKIMTSVNTKSLKSPYISKSQYADLEEKLFTFFCKLRDQKLPVSGPILKAKAANLALKMGYPEFLCSGGWLDNFRKRYNITLQKVCGEEEKVDDKSVSEWHTINDPIISSYSLKDRFNMDETGLFFKALPESTLAIRGEKCHGGQKSKDRITVSLFTNQDGSEKFTPTVIGKAAKPRCFKNVHHLPVPSEFNDYLTKIEKIAITRLDSSMKQTTMKDFLSN